MYRIPRAGRQWFCGERCTSLTDPVTRPHTIPPPREFSDALAGGGDEQPPKRWFQKDPKSTIAVRRFAGPMVFREQLQHLRVAHLTDLHVGRVTPMAVQEAAVDITNALAPDLVVITGDFVCHSQAYLDALEALMKRFTVPVLGVLGNHDYWSGADEVRRALRRGGVEVLDNQSTVLTLRGQKLQVVGLDDAYTGHADREKALKGLRHDVATLGLTHIGEEADRLWPRGVPRCSRGTRTRGRSPWRGSTSSRSGASRGTSTCTGSTARARRPTPRAARSTWARASARR